MFDNKEMGFKLRASEAILNSPVCFNSQIVSSRLNYVYSVITLIVDWLDYLTIQNVADRLFLANKSNDISYTYVGISLSFSLSLSMFDVL